MSAWHLRCLWCSGCAIGIGFGMAINEHYLSGLLGLIVGGYLYAQYRSEP